MPPIVNLKPDMMSISQDYPKFTHALYGAQETPAQILFTVEVKNKIRDNPAVKEKIVKSARAALALNAVVNFYADDLKKLQPGGLMPEHIRIKIVSMQEEYGRTSKELIKTIELENKKEKWFMPLSEGPNFKINKSQRALIKALIYMGDIAQEAANIKLPSYSRRNQPIGEKVSNSLSNPLSDEVKKDAELFVKYLE